MDISDYYRSGLLYPEGGWPDGPSRDDFLTEEREHEDDTFVQQFLASNHMRARSSV